VSSNNPYAGSPAGVLIDIDIVEQQTEPYRQLTWLDKLALWASWAAALGIFLTLGWMAMSPDDPYGAVSLLLRAGATEMWLQVAGLAVVVSAIGTILVGRVLPFAGPFAAAVGLTAVTLRGRTAESMLIAARSSELGTSGLAAQLLYEACAWMIVIALAFLMAAGVTRWCFPAAHPAPSTLSDRHSPLPGAAFAPLAGAIGLIAFGILGAGMNNREIRHSQVIFVVAAAVWLGCYFAFRIVPSRGLHWYLSAVGLMCVAGYAIAAVQGDSQDLPMTVPPSNFLRVLPVQFVAAGTAACIAAYWSNLNHWVNAEQSAGMDDDEDQP
jgi:hypothetical protein